MIPSFQMRNVYGRHFNGETQPRNGKWNDLTMGLCVFERCKFYGKWDVFALDGCEFLGCDLQRAEWVGGSIENSRLHRVRLPEKITDVAFKNCVIIGCDLRNAGSKNTYGKRNEGDFSGANAFDSCTFVACIMPELRWNERQDIAKTTDGRHMYFHSCEFLTDAPSQDWHPDEVMPEDFYM